MLVRQLLQGKALSVEDIADILSLKDNEDDIEHYSTALHVLSRAEVCVTIALVLLITNHICRTSLRNADLPHSAQYGDEYIYTTSKSP